MNFENHFLTVTFAACTSCSPRTAALLASATRRETAVHPGDQIFNCFPGPSSLDPHLQSVDLVPTFGGLQWARLIKKVFVFPCYVFDLRNDPTGLMENTLRLAHSLCVSHSETLTEPTTAEIQFTSIFKIYTRYENICRYAGSVQARIK